MVEALETAPGALPAGLDVAAWLAELPRRARVGGSGPRPGHMHVAGLRGGGHSGRARTVLVGLDDGRFPPAGLQDPLVLDAERHKIDAELPTSGSRVDDAVERFSRLMCRLRGSVVLSFSSRDVTDGRETFASPVVLAAYRVLSGDPEADHGDLAAHLGPPRSFAPTSAEAALDAGEWWMAQGAAEPQPTGLPEQLAATYPQLERGRLASAARAGDEFTVHDGLVESPGPELDPRNRTHPVSASRLQTLGQCPLQYFYGYVLGIWPPEDVEVDPSEWLDGRRFGTLLHEVLYDFVGELIVAKLWPPEAERDAERMARVLETRLEQWRATIPPPGEEPYTRQRRRLERAAEIFVNELGGARREPHGRPLYLEAAVGMDPVGSGTPLDTPTPVEIELPGGGRILARARLDRVDAIERPGASRSFGIIDYKSGGYAKPFDPPDAYARGRVLQPVLYMALAEVALRDRVTPDAEIDGFTFLFPDVRTHGRSIVHARALVTGGLDVIAKLCAMAGRGAFPATDDTGDCRFCDYKPACRSVSPDLEELCGGSQRKCANEKNSSLKEFVELRVARS
jgi:ATP-dependent helicase/nuclease subunit B